MHIRSIVRAAALLATAASASALHAQFPTPNPNTPGGLQGRDWDAVAFTTAPGHVAVVTLANVTQDTSNGNWSGFELYIDGARQPDYRINEAEAAMAVLVRRPGYHNVQVRCTNFHAAVKSCRASAMRVDEGAAF